MTDPVESTPPSTPLPSVPVSEPVEAPASAAVSSSGMEASSTPPPVAEPPLLEIPAAPPPPEPAKFIFHGDAREYFRIWIVNTLLSLLTVGLFSPWAKVRKRRYLRGNTELLGNRFNYTADPRRILIGTLIMGALFLGYALFGAVYPVVRVGSLLLLVILLPWIVVRSLAFNAHHTMYRGLRLHFHPSLSAAVMVYLLQPLVILFSFGFYYPAWVRARQQFVVERHRLGTAVFRTRFTSGPFYRAYLGGAGFIVIGALVVGLTQTLLVTSNRGHVATSLQLAPALLFYAGMFFVAKTYVFARLFNPIWNNTRLDDHVFRANMKTGRWLKLQLSNLGAIAISGGLLYPWAIVRSTRYALSCLELVPAGSLDSIRRLHSKDGSALGDTAAEFAGLDFGL